MKSSCFLSRAVRWRVTLPLCVSLRNRTPVGAQQQDLALPPSSRGLPLQDCPGGLAWSHLVGGSAEAHRGPGAFSALTHMCTHVHDTEVAFPEARSYSCPAVTLLPVEKRARVLGPLPDEGTSAT